MSNKSLTLDAAAEIDRYTKASIAKINENANLLFSRIADANARALSAAKDLEKLGKSSGRQFESAMDAACKANTAAAALDEKIKVAQNDIEELLHDLSIARAGVDGINAIIGKVVTLKSVSDVKMTAAKMADDGGVLCVWMHDGVVQSASIPLDALAIGDATTFNGASDTSAAKERERQSDKIRAHIGRCTMSVYGTQAECKAARDALERLLDDEA